MNITEVPIRYTSSSSAWTLWESRSPLLNGTIIAILTTIISYQLSAITLDFAFGSKPAKVAPVHAFQTLLLVRRSSPIAIANATLRQDWLTKRFFSNEISSQDRILRDNKKIRPLVAFKLFLCLSVVPLANILSVILSLERERPVTFGEVGFRVGLGVNMGSDIVAMSAVQTEVCRNYLVEEQRGDVMKARFSYCTFRKAMQNSSEPLGVIAAVKRSKVFPVVTVQVGRWHQKYGKRLTLQLQDTYRSRFFLSEEAMEWLLDQALERLLRGCGTKLEDVRGSLSSTLPQESRFKEFQGKVWNGGCSALDDQEMKELVKDVLEEMEQRITMVKVENMEVMKAEDFNVKESFEWMGVEGDVLLTRNMRYLSLPYMGILTGILLLFRLFVMMLLHNDVNDGIERLVKERLGLRHYDSLLSEGNYEVHYHDPTSATVKSIRSELSRSTPGISFSDLHLNVGLSKLSACG